MKIRACLALAALTLAACSGQTGSESSGCEAVSSTELELEEATPLGFSGADMLALAVGEREATLTWDKGGSTPLTIDAEHAGDKARYVERSFQNADSGREIAFDCPNLVKVDVVLTFRTEDGAFAETFAAHLHASEAGEATASATRELSAVEGTYELTEVDTSDADSANLSFIIGFDASGATGTVSAHVTFTEGDPNDPESAAGSHGRQVASF